MTKNAIKRCKVMELIILLGNQILYIVMYKSHPIYSEIANKIKCHLYVGETKSEGIFGIILGKNNNIVFNLNNENTNIRQIY